MIGAVQSRVGALVALISRALALIGGALTLIGAIQTRFSALITLIGGVLARIGSLLALIGGVFTAVGGVIAPVCGVHARRGSLITLIGWVLAPIGGALVRLTAQRVRTRIDGARQIAIAGFWVDGVAVTPLAVFLIRARRWGAMSRRALARPRLNVSIGAWHTSSAL